MVNQVQIGQWPIFAGGSASLDSTDGSGSFNLLGYAQEVMLFGVDTMQKLGAQRFARIKADSQLARDAQEMANRVDRALSGYLNPKDKYELPEGVADFMFQNGITVDNKMIWQLPTMMLKGDMQAVKAALDNYVSKQTDIGQQANLEIQKITTTYNYLIDAIKTLTSKAGDLNQGIMNKL